jgi:hypothetical protein
VISVVLPTIAGREAMLEQTVAAFKATANGHGLQFIVIRGRPTCGEAWNEGAVLASGDYLMLGADDLLPHPGWADVAVSAAEEGVYPGPWIQRPDGSTECCGTLGCGLLLSEEARDGLPVVSSPVPFMHRNHWRQLGPSIPAHYYSDDYLGYRARLAGLKVELRRGYLFTHLDGTVGRAKIVTRSASDRAMYAEAVTKL